MNLKARVFVMASSLMWAIICFWLFATPLVLALPAGGLIYVILGGKNHA